VSGNIAITTLLISSMDKHLKCFFVGGNNGSIPPTLEGWVYIIPIHGPLDGPLYTWAQYTLTVSPIKWHVPLMCWVCDIEHEI